MNQKLHEKIETAKSLDDQEKLLELAALGLGSIYENQELVEALLPHSLKTNLNFAKKVCAKFPTLAHQFDASIFKNRDFILHVFKANQTDLFMVAFGKMRMIAAAFKDLIASMPSELKKDRPFVLKAVQFCPVHIYNWCASEYENDEEFEKIFVENYHKNRGFHPDLKGPIKYTLAVKLCEFNGKNYNSIKRFYPTDVPLACTAVSAPNGNDVHIQEMDKAIRYNATRLARVIANSIHKDEISAYLADQECNVIAKAVYKIDPNKEELRYSDNVYKAAKFICDHEDAKLEKATLKKALTKTAQKVPKRSALKDTL